MRVNLRKELQIPAFDALLEGIEDTLDQPNRRIDLRLYLFATLLALYPFTESAALAEEFRMSEHYIKTVANNHYVHKSESVRSDINSRNGRKIFLKRYWAYKKKKLKQTNNK